MLFIIYVVRLQHPYVYGVLVFEAMATFIGQVSVLSLIALFGAATTAMVRAPETTISEQEQLRINETECRPGIVRRLI